MITGCKLHNNCFTCPFPDCKVDKTQHLYTDSLKVRAKTMRLQGLTFREIAKRLDKHIGTIQRYVKE